MAGDLDQEGNCPLKTFYYKVNHLGWGYPSPVPVGLWVVARASQLVCPKLARLCFNKVYRGGVITSLMGTGTPSSCGAVTWVGIVT